MSKKKNKGQLKYVYNHIKRLLGLVKENVSIGSIMIVIGIVAGLISILVNYIYGQLLDIALIGELERLIQFAILLIIAGMVQSIISYISIFLAGKYRIRCGKTLRRKACKKVSDLSIAYYENNHTGSTVSTLISDIDKLESFFISSV